MTMAMTNRKLYNTHMQHANDDIDIGKDIDANMAFDIDLAIFVSSSSFCVSVIGSKCDNQYIISNDKKLIFFA